MHWALAAEARPGKEGRRRWLLLREVANVQDGQAMRSLTALVEAILAGRAAAV
ncbi:MAG: hypothetical protein HY535_05720 [Chloroflexi bacterium]|nr:hypothetical protein [Chloroflexota bacterium]